VWTTPPIFAEKRYSARWVSRSDDGLISPSTSLPSKSRIGRACAPRRSEGTPLGLMAIRPRARSIPLAFPKVKRANPLRDNSRLASRTCSRNVCSSIVSIVRLFGDPPQQRQDAAHRHRLGRLPAQSEIGAPPRRVEFFVHRGGLRLRFDDAGFRAQPMLRFFDAMERARGQEREDRRAEAGDLGFGHQHRLVQDVGVHAVQYFVLLRHAATVDYAADGNAMPGHTVEYHSRVEGRS